MSCDKRKTMKLAIAIVLSSAFCTSCCGSRKATQTEDTPAPPAEAERDAAMEAIGRYYGLATKQGLQNAAQETQKALEALPSLLEGFMDAFK